jgi:hypothetical protein
MSRGRCPCTFCLTGKAKLCVWRDAPAIELVPYEPQTPRWRTVLDWTLCIVFAITLVFARLLAS